MHIKNFILLLFVLTGCIRLFGQESRKEICIGFSVGNGELDATYRDNAERLSEIVSFLEYVQNDTLLNLVEVSFCSSSSPEGGFGRNRKLAEMRRSSLENYVRKHVLLPDSIVTRCESFVDWEHLARLTEQSDMPYKEEAIDVLRNIPEFTYDDTGALIDSRKKHLMELQYGRTWNYMLQHFFPLLRNAGIVFVSVQKKTEVEETDVPDERQAEPISSVDTLSVARETDTVVWQPDKKRPFYMAIKTNMLYDVLAVPNIGVEFYLKKNWSIAGNWMYSWWNTKSGHRYWRVYGGDIAVRKWLGKKAAEKPLQGHHLGLYGQLFTYDFEWGGTGYMGGEPGGTLWDEPNFAVGVEYGYSLPITRRLNIDFNIGVGYWGGKYYKYRPIDGHYVWEVSKKRHWFGPTKAEIALVWLLGRGNKNNGKGGIK